MTVDLTPEQIAGLDQLASATGRAAEDIVREAVENLLAYNEWFRQQVQDGLDQLERGEYLEDGVVRMRIEKRYPR